MFSVVMKRPNEGQVHTLGEGGYGKPPYKNSVPVVKDSHHYWFGLLPE
jgi:hypothetical protein